MSKIKTLCAIVAGLLTVTVGGPAAHAADFVFTNIIDTTFAAPVGNFEGFGKTSLSNGVVGFRGDYDGSASAVYIAVEGFQLLISKTGDAAPSGTFTGYSNPTFSQLFTGVGYTATYSSGAGLFISTGGPPTTGPAFNTPVISFTGDVAMVSGLAYSGVTGGVGVVQRLSGFVTTIASTGDAAPTGVFDDLSGDVALNAAGTVAFRAVYGGFTAQGIFMGNGGALTTVAKTGDAAPTGTFDSFDQSPSLSGGDVAFIADFNGFADSGVFIGDGVTLTTIAKTGDAAPLGAFEGFGDVTINNGIAAFLGIYNGFSANGIFVGNGNNLISVVKSGDDLFGSTVTILGLSHFGFDNMGNGQLAFNYELADGRHGIAITLVDVEFASVPEPATLGMAGIAAAAVLIRRRR